ncbi:MAG: C39 family peptidase, partial [Candidatus Binatia bacterium]
VRIPSTGTPIYDINGTILFYRLTIGRGKAVIGFVDIACEESLGEPLLAVSMGPAWSEKRLLEEGQAVANKGRRRLHYDTVRFVAYSYPKVALQFLSDGREVLMLELFTWAEVPPLSSRDRKPLEPSNFERWSLLDELPPDIRRSRTRNFRRRLRYWDVPALRRTDPRLVSKEVFRRRDFAIRLNDTQEIHYSPRDTDHHPCYELRGQQTNVWCVGASAEMVLNFYRYSYDQIRLAQELGLGTLANPNGLPYARVGDVVTVIENLTSDALDVTMHTNPNWSAFRNEIRANRPVISFVPGHSRTVVGYTQNRIFLVNQISFQGLLVYDPWPPNAGVITRWENFATQTYQYAYSSVLQHV